MPGEGESVYRRLLSTSGSDQDENGAGTGLNANGESSIRPPFSPSVLSIFACTGSLVSLCLLLHISSDRRFRGSSRCDSYRMAHRDAEGEGEVDVSLEGSLAPDQVDEKTATSKYEIWAYYAYFIGNSGLTLFNFAPSAFQNLLSQAAGDAGILRFAGQYANLK